jgi:hypothetical protein
MSKVLQLGAADEIIALLILNGLENFRCEGIFPSLEITNPRFALGFILFQARISCFDKYLGDVRLFPEADKPVFWSPRNTTAVPHVSF